MTYAMPARGLLDRLDEATAVLFLLVGPAIGVGIVLVWAAGLALTLLTPLLR
jgi:hypothetical protein